jgi:hypothetical protein
MKIINEIATWFFYINSLPFFNPYNTLTLLCFTILKENFENDTMKMVNLF